MKSNQGLWIALAALLAVGSSIGCYTLLKHPRVQTEDEVASPYEPERVSFADNCTSCHNAASLAYHQRAVPLPAQFVSPRWDYYYDYPWWIPYYAAGDATSEEEQKQRPFDRRHMRQPDESNPTQASSPQPAPNPSTVVAKPGDSGNTPPADQPKSQDSGKRDEKRSGDGKSSDRRTRKP
jgi:hypothetical protein